MQTSHLEYHSQNPGRYLLSFLHANGLNDSKHIQAYMYENCKHSQMAFSFLKDKRLTINIKSVDNKYGVVS